MKIINFKLKNSIALRIMIAKAGKSIRQFSSDIEVSSTYMSLIINGKRNPSAHVAYKIANGLGLEIEHLFEVNNKKLMK